MLPRLAALLALALVPASKLDAQLARHPRVQEAIHLAERWLDAERAYKRIPGVSAAVVRDQTVIWSGGSGYADLAAKRPATPNTIYSICSISKLFTSVAAMTLRDQGKLRLDDPVGKHLPWFTVRQRHPESGEITVEGLLTHASGLPREAAYPYWSGPDFAFPTREEIVKTLSAQSTLYPAETYFQYSNLGMSLLGQIVEQASGRPYHDYVKTTILAPLGLSQTTSEMPAAERGKALATGYGAIQREGERPVLPFFTAKGIAPAAGYASSALDLAKFASWQLRLLGGTPKEILDRNTLREMQRVHFVEPDFSTHWGLGFVVYRSDDETFVGHGGSCPGYQTQLMVAPKPQIAVVAMSNAIDVNAGALARGLYAIMAPALKEAAADTGNKAQARDDEETAGLAAYTGTYESYWGGEQEILVWKGQLASIGLPTDRPAAAITRLKRTGEHAFRRIRDDGELAEEWRFELGADGRAARLVQNYNVSRRLR